MKIITLTKKELTEMLKEKNLLPFNRDISNSHVSKMIKSVQSCGLLRLPIIGKLLYKENPTLSIIDAQHLCSALVKIDDIAEVHCILKEYDSKKDVIRDIAIINNTQKTWNDENYLEAWFKYGKDNVEFYSNYSYLYNIYNNHNLPCGFLVDLYADSKDNFRDGELRFKNREVSDKVLAICEMLKEDYKKGSFTLHGLRIWVNRRIYQERKEIDFVKLTSRIKHAMRNAEDKNVTHHRDQFADWLERVYTRV